MLTRPRKPEMRLPPRSITAICSRHLEQESGPDHPDTLIAQYNKAHWTGMAGNAADACTQIAALRAQMEKLCGRDDEDTLALGAKHAYWTWQAGDFAAARDLYAALLPAMFAALGREHPYVLEVRAEFATCLALTGDVVEALKQFSALVPETERVLGAEHPQTFAARTSVAAMTDQAGRQNRGPSAARRVAAPSQAGVWPSGPDNPRCPRQPHPTGPRTRRMTATYRDQQPCACLSPGRLLRRRSQQPVNSPCRAPLWARRRPRAR